MSNESCPEYKIENESKSDRSLRGKILLKCLLTYSRVPNKRPVSNKRPGWKFLLKKGTIFGQMKKKGEISLQNTVLDVMLQ